jgi:hypothetical protein
MRAAEWAVALVLGVPLAVLLVWLGPTLPRNWNCRSAIRGQPAGVEPVPGRYRHMESVPIVFWVSFRS